MKIRYNQIPYKWISVVSFIVLFAWVAAGVVMSIAGDILYKPPIPQKPIDITKAMHNKPSRKKSDYDVIILRDLFKVARAGPGSMDKIMSLGAFSSPGLVLKGTIAGPENLARAIIEENNQQRIYQIGDSMKGGVIQAISRYEVILSVGGMAQRLAMKFDIPNKPEDPKLASHPEPIKEIVKRLPDATVNPDVPPASFPALVLSSSPVAPSVAKSQALTDIIQRVRRSCSGEDTGMSQYGVQAGDIIRSINGIPVRYQGESMRPTKTVPLDVSDVMFELERNHYLISVNIPITSYSYWKGV